MARDWNEIYGEHADLLAYSKRRKNVLAPLQEFFDFLNEYIVTPDPDYPDHRDHLSHGEWRWLVSLLNRRFGLKTFMLPLPSLSWWAQELHISRKHLIQMYRFLVKQGLLLLPEGHKQGRRLCFGVDALCGKVREWLRDRKEIAPQVEVSQPELDPWFDAQPIEIQQLGPEEDEEDVPLPVAAMVPAIEWDVAQASIEREIGHEKYLRYFAGLRAFWIGEKLTVKTPDREKCSMLQTLFRRVINRNVGYDVCIRCEARSA